MPEGKIHHNLLVVDDDELIISLLEDYLTELGYDVTSATNAEYAIEKLNNGNKFNLVLTDVNLPGKSGLELLKIINETIDELPVILFTGLKTLDTAISALQSGAEDYITKPFDLMTVRKVVEKVLKKQKRVQKKEKIFGNLQNLKMGFEFRTDQLDPGVLARELAGTLQKMHFSEEDTIKQFELAFTETLINGLEHGNLELPSSIKSNDLLQMAEFEELKESRLQDENFAGRLINIIFDCDENCFSFTVRDQGPGFDWKKYLDEDHKINSAKLDSHGRGFMIIRHIIDEVYFNENGNTITLVKHK